MGLAVLVGPLAYHRENDATIRGELMARGLPLPTAEEEGERYIRRQLEEVNRVLTANGLPPHIEPESPPELKNGVFVEGGMSYSWFHYLRRAVAYARREPEAFGPVAEGEDPGDDELVELDVDSHLIYHSDSEGFYVPIDFDGPLHDDTGRLAGTFLGSSQRALAEVIQAAPLLDIGLRDGRPTKDALDTILAERDGGGPLWRERYVWLCMYEALRLSVEHGCAVQFA